MLFLGLFAAALASLVVRFRAASGDERQQLRIVAATVCFGLTGIALFELLVLATDGRAAGDEEAVRYTVWLAAALLIPISVGVAILRYRLYDVERVISRTIVYAALTLILGAAYTGLVLAGQALFSTFAGGLEPGDRRVDARGGGAVPAGAPSRAGLRRPALLPAPLRRAAHAGRVRGAVAAGARPGGARRRPERRRRRDDAAGARLAVAP